MRSIMLSLTAATALFAAASAASAGGVPTQEQMQKYCPAATYSINCSIPQHAMKSHSGVQAFAIPTREQDIYARFKERDARASFCAEDGELDCPR